jgi:hypothetical protein
MMHKLPRSLIATGLLAYAAGAAWAQPAPIKPGLWQMRMEQDNPEMAAKMREMEAQMKSMPPETRKQVEAMMKQHGMSVSAPGEIRMCYTKEQLSSENWANQHQDASCKTDTTRSGSTWKFHSVCPAPRASETDGEATFTSPERYTVKSSTTSTEGGQAKTVKMSVVSTWLGADCGDVKPIGSAKPK